MAEKTLKITFSGICTLTPPGPGNLDSQESKPERVFVVMPAGRNENQSTRDKNGTIGRHKAFVYVARRFLDNPIAPDDSVVDQRLGDTNIYYVDHARLAVTPLPGGAPGVEYFIDGLPIDEVHERPGSIDAASEHDMRWMVDLRDVFPGRTLRFNPDCDPSQPSVGDVVAMVVELTKGTLRANFPCKTTQPQSFEQDGKKLGFARVYASEFFIELKYPESTGNLRIGLAPLNSGSAVDSRIAGGLTLRWQDDVIELRMGNDKIEEIRRLVDGHRCDLPTVPRPRDNDFDLHYNLFALGSGSHPLPVPSGLHVEHGGCLGGKG